jgi:hypothetical protein
MDPCLYSIATLKGFVLRDIDITKAFAAMIKRKVLNLKEDDDDNDDGDDDQFPFTPEKLLKNIDKGPLPDLYKVISLALKCTYATNNCGYTITKCKNLATKVWSLANDTLINGDKNAKQKLLGMTINRTAGSKIVSNILHKINHETSYNDIIKQNHDWERLVTWSS